jgi:hypothetical protein
MQLLENVKEKIGDCTYIHLIRRMAWEQYMVRSSNVMSVEPPEAVASKHAVQ